MKRKFSAVLLTTYALAVILCLFCVFPLLWSILTSLKTPTDVYSMPLHIIPQPLTLENYSEVLFNSVMMRFFLNSTIVSCVTTVVSTTISLLAAYGFSRFKFPGGGTLFGTILFSRILPRVTLLIPFYVVLARLHLINTIPGLVLVYLIVAMPITVWMMKGFVDTIPVEIEEAATVDGCGPYGILFRIVVPVLAPAIAAISMFAFILSWNEFLFPLLITKDLASRTISVGLAFFIDDAGVKWGPLMAASVMMGLPPIIAFTYAQKYIIKGLSEGAVKG
jgi:ABC-type glycerol-3-phosphate transport system permease component